MTGSTVLWEGSLRPTTFVSSAQLTASITEEDIASAGGDIATAQVTVCNSPPGGGLSVPASFAIVSADVSEVDSNTAGPGSDASSSTAPDAAGEAGVSATLTNNTDGSDPATVTAANYESDPNQTGVLDVGGGYVDLQVNGADASDTLDASFYYSSTITGQTEADLRLLYYTGAAWKAVLSNGGDFPTKDTPDNLDGTISGGRFSVTFDDTSTPTITGLSGTVMTFTLDTIPPTIAAARLPATGNTNGWNDGPVTVSYTASDAESGIDAGASDLADDVIGEGAGQKAEGTAVDNSGNSATAKVTDINVDLTDPLISASASPPANDNGWNRTDVTVSYTASDAPSGIDLAASDIGDDLLTAEAAGQSATGTAVDLAGNPASATASGINIDKTDLVVTPPSD